MKFGPVPVAEAEGCILAHGTLAGMGKLKKGTRLSEGHIRALQEAGIDAVIAARLEPGDLDEDEAATRLSMAMSGANITCAPAATGRVNLYAQANGVFLADKAGIDRLNRIDTGITFATLAEYSAVIKGQMVATVKIIPFAVAGSLLTAIDSHIFQALIRPVSVAAYDARRVSVISTLLPGLKPSVVDKTLAVLAARLAASGSAVVSDRRVAHDEQEVSKAIAGEAEAGAELIVVFGASAVVDEDDVIPAAITLAGGIVEHVGMPVDPGNLMVLGRLGSVSVLGAPGCARSPRENGFDFVLSRLLADIPVTPNDITGMGVGGLLMEIPSRPQPREGALPKKALKIGALVLAAGQSRRSGGSHKLNALFDGVPLLRRTTETVIATGFTLVRVVLGYEYEAFSRQLSGLDVEIIHNPLFADGISTSLKAGIAHSPDMDGVLVMLADMPAITSDNLLLLKAAFIKSGGDAIIRATDNGKRGNPIILPRLVFPELARLQGDVGAKPIVEGFEGRLIDVEIGAAASLDVDTAEGIKAAGGELAG